MRFEVFKSSYLYSNENKFSLDSLGEQGFEFQEANVTSIQKIYVKEIIHDQNVIFQPTYYIDGKENFFICIYYIITFKAKMQRLFLLGVPQNKATRRGAVNAFNN